jgi:pilus assembly protein Flp/PilA
MMGRLISVFANEDGPVAVEYALIAGLVAVAIIAALTLLGLNLSRFFNYLGNQVPAP